MMYNATNLGKIFKLNSEQMNMVLKLLGYLEGEPGDYDVTSKGYNLANLKEYHRGNGGYERYNAYWSTRTWKSEIIENLKKEVTSEVITEAKEILDNRKQQLKFERNSLIQSNNNIEKIVEAKSVPFIVKMINSEYFKISCKGLFFTIATVVTPIILKKIEEHIEMKGNDRKNEYK